MEKKVREKSNKIHCVSFVLNTSLDGANNADEINYNWK